MKKTLLAAGIAVAMGALSGVASAALEVNTGGVGQINVLPYYSVQEGNDTLITITNTDRNNGKAVKVRFRGAEWSDDVFDFQIFLSPGDAWTGAVTKNGNVAKLVSADTSCTLPANVNLDFVDIRLQAGQRAVGTLEGYVEIITMADIPPTGTGAVIDGTSAKLADWANTKDLYNAIKHVADGSPACRTEAAAQTLLNNLTPDNPLDAAAIPQANWMVPPTTGLTTHSTIINVPTSKAFTFSATALVETAPALVVAPLDGDQQKVKYYFRQANATLTVDPLLTADRIFYPVGAAANELGADVPMYQFDMPDLSTPTYQQYVGVGPAVLTNVTAATQRNQLAVQLQRPNVTTEYVTNDALLASTDVVISQPVRRYFYNYAQQLPAATAFDLLLTDSLSVENKYNVSGEAATMYSTLVGSTNRIAVGDPVFYDHEENTFTSSSDIVISPTPPSAIMSISLKGEVSVVSINNSGLPTGALNASLTANDYTATGGYADGWTTLSTTATGAAMTGQLPVIGFSAINLFNAGAGSAGTNYGMTLPLK